MTVLSAVLAAAACAVVAALGLALWAGSSLLLVPRRYELMPEFTVLDYRAGRVTLPAPPSKAQFADTRKGGVVGLLWRNGYGRLGPVVEDDGARLVRPLEVVAGVPPTAGEPARIDTFLYHRDPGQDLGLAFEDVRVASDVGELAGWWLPGSGTTAVLVLHGRRRGERAETLRVVPALADGERSVLVLAYRNHRGSPASPDGFYHYGVTEADDALAAVALLAARGVERVVLYGFSMGGATALEAAKRWPAEGPSLAGLILDSPLIDPAAVAEQRIRRAGVPFPRAWARATLALAAWRAGLRWRGLDQRTSAQRIGVPVLLIAGVDDGTVPIDAVDGFAHVVAGPLRYRRVAGADHIEAWNLDPEAYEGWVRDFLEELGRGSRDA